MRVAARTCVAVLLLGGALAVPAPAERAHGAEPVPPLNVALPRRLVDPASRATGSDRLVPLLAAVLGRSICPGPLCPPGHDLQMQLAVGNDYEVLDWLGKGLVDAAVVPTLSLYLLQRDQIELVLLGPPARSPAPSTPRSRHRISGAWRDGPDPAADLEAARDWLWCEAVTALPAAASTPTLELERRRCWQTRSAGPSYELVMPSHLSTRGFLGPMDETARWLVGRQTQRAGTSEAERRAIEARFWEALFAHARFTLGVPVAEDATTGPRATIRIFFEDAPVKGPASGQGLRSLDGDHLVVRRTRKAVDLQRARPARPTSLPSAIGAILGADRRAEVPAAFRSLRFSEPYFGVRTFEFTVGETLEILRGHRDDPGNLRLALVLPGGGVKAAYQSRLLEHLYSTGQLRNQQAGPGDGRALPVNYVIGTSGGALLGFFVARLGESGPWTLSDLLWKLCPGPGTAGSCRLLTSTDVFGYVDMMRYVSALLVFFVLWGLLSGARAFMGARHAPPVDVEPLRRLRLLLGLGVILLLAPLVIRHMNGPAGREHIPAVEGVFYAAFALLCMFVDQCAIRDQKWSAPPRAGWRHLGMGLTLAGEVLVAACVMVRELASKDRWLNQPREGWIVQPSSLLVCMGFLLLLVGATLWAYASRPQHRLIDVRGFCAGLGLVLGHLLAVYAVVFVVVSFRPQALSFLELTGQFWGWLIVISLAVGVVILAIGWAAWRVGGRLLRWALAIPDGVMYLSGNHPNRGRLAWRALRLFLVAILATGWWNFIMAPGLYGNQHAQAFMDRLIEQFDRSYRSANLRSSSRLTASLIVPANDLDRGQTSYFLFAPDVSDECPPLVRRPGDDAVWRRFRVPVDADRDEGASQKAILSCETGSEWPRKQFRKVVFASGSPFPVFPAHEVDGQRLVDGGYSNLVPVDAAQTVSAEAVLIVGSSSPLGPEDVTPGWWSRVPGDLVKNLPQILGFLYERSQQVDRLSRPDLLVVSLAPRRDEPDWPFLTDFRSGVIQRMIQTAEGDLSRRIGLVQSWGRPRFAQTVPSPG